MSSRIMKAEDYDNLTARLAVSEDRAKMLVEALRELLGASERFIARAPREMVHEEDDKPFQNKKAELQAVIREVRSTLKAEEL